MLFEKEEKAIFLRSHKIVNCFINSGGKPLQCIHYFEKIRLIIFDKISFKNCTQYN